VADETATLSITVTALGDEWRVQADERPLGCFPTRALAYEVAVTFAELSVRGGGRAEIVCNEQGSGDPAAVLRDGAGLIDAEAGSDR
jgi:hypothetical protein